MGAVGPRRIVVRVQSPGITLDASAASPSGDAGTYEWAQIISKYDFGVTYGSTTAQCAVTIGLDSAFPYPGSVGLTSEDDSLFVSLGATYYSKETLSFGATFYFMWEPEEGSDPIAVPLGYVAWTASGEATESEGTWTVEATESPSATYEKSSTSWSRWSTGQIFIGNATCPE
jgi:hypothetical protein